jgi:hypothetical protein
MRSFVKVFVCLLAGGLVVAAPVTARAQAQDEEAPQPPPPPSYYPPASAQAPNGEWVAPLQQRTQPSYVPQSVALSGPRILTDWEQGEPIPPGYHPRTRARTGMIVAGAVTFGTLYLFTALVAAAGADSAQTNGTSNQYGALWVPGVGPFLQMTNTSSATGNYVLAIDGLAQCAGLAMLIYGISSPRTVLVRDDLAKPLIMPMRIGQDGYGMGVLGRF